MVDFSKKIKNSNKFIEPAIRYEMTGSYCSYPPGTSEYYDFWEEEKNRCINGYTAEDGDYITGYNYFYLNYCRIKRIYRKEVTRNGVTKLRTFREEGFADFYDYDYFYFQAIDEAEFQGKHLPILKARGKGYSFKGASMLCRNFFLLPGSISYAFAGTKEYLLKDGILSKAKDIIDFINENTAWTKKMDVKNTEMHRRASFQVTDEAGNKIEVGYKSEIIGVVLDDPNKARGKRCKLALIEEAGSCNDLLTAIQILRPSVEEDGEAYGIIIPFGTGGEEGANFDGLKELFFHGDGYNFLQFDNIWSDGAQGTKCGFFVPEWANMSKTDESGNRLYMDKDGNSIMSKALELIKEEREKVIQGATNSQAVDRYIAEHPITPEEACLTLTGNIFPKKALQTQLAKIRTNKKLQNLKQIGELTLVNGQVQWSPKKQGDITKFPLGKDDDPTGSIVIWEHPPKDPPIGMFIACCLTEGEKVLTNNGLVNVEDVTFENKLVSKDGKLVDIINLQRYDKVDEDIYTIKPATSFRTTTFTREHPILLKSDEFVKAEDVKEKDWLVIPNRYKEVKNDYSKIIKETFPSINEGLYKELFYFFGLMLGDGFTNINNKSHDVYLVIGKKELELASVYDDLVYKLFNRKTIHIKQKEGLNNRRFTNKELVLFLDEHFKKYANSKEIPEWLKYAPDELKLSFIQGYLDTDGCVLLDKKKIRVNFTSVNLSLLESIQDILFSLGIIGSIVRHQKETVTPFNNKESYRINVYSKYIDKLLDSSPVYFSRKLKLIEKYHTNNIRHTGEKAVISSCGKYIFLQVEKINKSKYTGRVYNFECDTHTFMCRNIVTHNCDPLNVAVLFLE